MMGAIWRRTQPALTYATAAHAAVGQRRKYTHEPYIVHPIRVANTVDSYGGTDDMISAAYLHDVVEDTRITIEDINDMFGSVVAVIVDGLTDVSVPEDGNRAVRKAMDRQHSADATWAAQFVKCADIIDNASDIGDNDPSFNVVYRKEMVSLLEVLDKVKDEPIYAAAVKAVA
jgi:(p)ppGpp synthase/HD superfamily hydrolase